MKLGDTATSPGVTARWERIDGRLSLRAARPLPDGRRLLGFIRGPWNGNGGHYSGVLWDTFEIETDIYAPHRYQAKRAVEAAVSQALREAGE